jgi:hypothetical protein
MIKDTKTLLPNFLEKSDKIANGYSQPLCWQYMIDSLPQEHLDA